MLLFFIVTLVHANKLLIEVEDDQKKPMRKAASYYPPDPEVQEVEAESKEVMEPVVRRNGRNRFRSGGVDGEF